MILDSHGPIEVLREDPVALRAYHAAQTAQALNEIKWTDHGMPEGSGVIYPRSGPLLTLPPEHIIFEVCGPPKVGKTGMLEDLRWMYFPFLNYVPEHVGTARERSRDTWLVECIKRGLNIGIINTAARAIDGSLPPMPTVCERAYCDNAIFSRAIFFQGDDAICSRDMDYGRSMECIHPGEFHWVVVMCLTPPEQYFERGGHMFSPEFVESLFEQYCRFHYEAVSGDSERLFTYVYLDMSVGDLVTNTNRLAEAIERVTELISGTRISRLPAYC